MNYKKIMLVTLALLAVLTISAVGAADMENLTAIDDDAGDAIGSPDDETGIIAIEDEDAVGDGEKYNATIVIERPDNMYLDEYFEFSAHVEPADDGCGQYPTGELIIYLNDEIICEEEYYSYFEYIEDIGVYNFKVEYPGDEYFNGAVDEFIYNVTNSMYHIQVPDVIDYGREEFWVYSPVWNPSNIEITINGKKFNAYSKEGEENYFCNASALEYGNNVISIYYPGDDRLAEYSAKENMTVMSSIEFNDENLVWGVPVEFFVELPSYATGTLNLYYVEYDDNSEVKSYTKIGSADVKDGIATASISGLSVARHNLLANFTGSVDVNEMEFCIYIDPVVNIPRSMIFGEDAYVTVESSNDTNAVVNVSYKIYDDYDEMEYNLLASAEVVDGQAKIPLFGLKQGKYNIYVQYFYHDDWGSFGDSGVLYVVDEYDVNLTITHLRENIVLDYEYVYVDFDKAPYAKGNVSLYIDGVLKDVIDTGEYSNFIYFNASGLSLGEHTLSISYVDELYGNSSDSAKFNVVAAIIDIPDKMNNNGYASANSIELEVHRNAKGTLTILVDNNEFLTERIDAAEDVYYHYGLNKVSRGKHDVCVTYADDKHGKVTQNKTVDFGYVFFIYGDCEYGIDNIVTVDVPRDLGNGEFTITIDGKKWDYVRNGSVVTVNPSKLSYGNHNVVVKYAGDDFYPAGEFNSTLEVYAEIQGDDGNMLIGTETGISLVLPEDAKGKLNITVKVEIDDEDGYRWEVYDAKLISLENGKAYYSLASLPLGSYRISASYTENDYEIYSNVFYIDVESLDWGDSYLAVGENKTITFVSQDSDGQLSIVLSRIIDEYKEWDDPINIYEVLNVTIVNGKASHTFTKLPIGEYHIFLTEDYLNGTWKGYQSGH